MFLANLAALLASVAMMWFGIDTMFAVIGAALCGSSIAILGIALWLLAKGDHASAPKNPEFEP